MGRLVKIFLSSLPIIGGISYIIQAFAPNQLGNKQVEFAFCVIRNGVPELIFISLVAIAVLVCKNVDVVLAAKSVWTKFRTDSFYRTLAVLLAFFFIINSDSIGHIFNARRYHYKHIYRVHKFEYYTRITENLNRGDFINAINQINELIEIYPQEEWQLKGIKTSLQERIDLSQKLYSLEKIFIKKESPNKEISKVYRTTFYNMLNAYALFPDKKYRDELISIHKSIEGNLSVIDTLYLLVKEKNEKQLIQYFDRNAWFLFDEHTINSIRTTGNAPSEYLRKICNSFSKDAFKSAVKKNWMLELSYDLISWGDSLNVQVTPLNFRENQEPFR